MEASSFQACPNLTVVAARITVVEAALVAEVSTQETNSWGAIAYSATTAVVIAVGTTAAVQWASATATAESAGTAR